jgi:PST family polysaccharide transporter
LDIEEAKRRAKAGPAILMIRRGFAIAVAFVSTITIARLVAPSAYGLANMSVVIFAFAAIFRDFGLTNAILRKGHISQSELSLIFWFNAAMTALLTVIVALASPFVARFYHEPIVQWVILVSLIGFLASGMTMQHRAIINRDLRFTALSVVDTIASVAGLLITIALAYLWRNVWAIVLGTVAQSIIASISCLWLSKWKPDKPRKSEELNSLLKFGGNSSVYSISVFLSQNISSILIGHFFGSSLLGQFNRAQALLNLPVTNLIQPITQAALPLMARLRSAPEEYRATYLALTRRLCIFLMPLAIALTLASVPLTVALLGEKWRSAGYILMALAPNLGIMGLVYAVSDLFVTQDRSAELRNLGLIELVIRVGSICIGLTYGVVGAAAAYSFGTTIVGFLRMYVVGRRGPVSTRDQFKQMLPALPLVLGAAIGGLLAWQTANSTAAATATLILGASAISALAVGLWFRGTRSALVELAEVFSLHKLMKFNAIARRFER